MFGMEVLETGSCLDPELPGTGLQTGGGEGAGPPRSRKRVCWNPTEMGKHEKKWKITHSRRDEGG